MEQLSRYHRVTVGLWARSHTQLASPTGQTCLAEAAVHALLAALRRCAEPVLLLACYEVAAAADFALIGSLVDGKPSDELFWRVRDSAYYLRWGELTTEDGSG
jgi:hypothetical protein